MSSIVLPVWDAYVGPALLEALDSLHQPAGPELIVVDNASKVALPQLPDIRVVRSPTRLSAGAARNLGLTHVRTPFVMFWDADDVIIPGTLAFLEDQLASRPELAAAAAAIVEDEQGTRHRWPRPWVARLTRRPTVFALADSVWSLYPTTGATLIRTELVRAAGGFADADSGEDWCLGVSVAFRGPVAWSERPGRLYRRHASSLWAQHMSPRHQLRHARTVRERIASDPAVPGWVKRARPLLAAAQRLAIGASAALRAARQPEGDRHQG